MNPTLIHTLKQPGAIRIDFQPMISIATGRPRLYALEALARGPVGSTVERPDVLFEYARLKGEETQLDVICIAQALAAASSLPGSPSISINVHGSTLSNVTQFAERFLDAAESYEIAPGRLMLEIVEHRAPWTMESFHSTLGKLRDAGVRIAVDDLGVGASNFRMIVDCRPDHLKIDRYIVNGCAGDPVRTAVIGSIVHLADSIGASAVAEGIEHDDDLEVVTSLGLRIIQGWLFAPAMPPAELARTAYLESNLCTNKGVN
jgi:EAL domain-containing protein (putative c-di-GMP-specific phosphodiesterase class I)